MIYLDMSELIKLSFEAHYDFIVRLAVRFAEVAEDVEETEESIDTEEEEDWVAIIVWHCTSDQRRNQGRES